MCSAVVQLNVTVTVSLRWLQSVAIYIHCATVWVRERKLQKCTFCSFTFLVRPSSWNSSRNSEEIFMKYYVWILVWFLYQFQVLKIEH